MTSQYGKPISEKVNAIRKWNLVSLLTEHLSIMYQQSVYQ